MRYVNEYKTAKFGTCGKIVLIGHSTGSQCVLHYLYRPNPHVRISPFDPDLEHEDRLPLDGAIMLAPISDREAIHSVLDEGMCGNTPEECRKVYEKLVAMARDALTGDERYDVILPISLTSQLGYGSDTPISARRFLSLASPDSPQSPGDDDLFSADLSDEQLGETFGAIRRRGLLRHKLMATPMGADQAVPEWIDKEKNLRRWKAATDHHDEFQIWDSAHSGVLPGASHAMSNDDQVEPRKVLVERLLAYLQDAASAE